MSVLRGDRRHCRDALVAGLALLLAPAAGGAATIVGVGEIRSDAKVAVKPKISVPIRSIAVHEGEVVRQGQLLVEMTNEVPRAQVAMARAEVQRAEASAAEAELQVKIAARELERNLKVPDLITQKELELSRDAVARAEADLRTKREDVAKARAQLAVAQANFDDTLIRAPFDGVVSRIYLRVGATPKVAETTILDFLTLDRLYVEVALPLPYLRAVREGMPVDVVVEDEHSAIKTATLGRIRYVYPEVDSTTRMFRVKIDLDRRDFQVLPGMLAKISVIPASDPRSVR